MIASTLDLLPANTPAVVAAIDWPRLTETEGRRLREFGFDEGVTIEVLHRASIGAGPIACRVGRMTIAMRRSVAATVSVSGDVSPQ